MSFESLIANDRHFCITLCLVMTSFSVHPNLTLKIRKRVGCDAFPLYCLSLWQLNDVAVGYFDMNLNLRIASFMGASFLKKLDLYKVHTYTSLVDSRS